MTEKPKNTGKHKPQKPYKGCMLSIAVVMLIPILCYSAMWLFARYGGEWAAEYPVSEYPIPDDSRFQFKIVQYDSDTIENARLMYALKTSFYTHPLDPEALRQWFIDAGVGMTPIPLNLEETSFMGREGIYETPMLFYFLSKQHEFHWWSATLTSGFQSDFTPSCHDIRIYQTEEALLDDFPDLDLSKLDDSTVFIVRTCWANAW